MRNYYGYNLNQSLAKINKLKKEKYDLNSFIEIINSHFPLDIGFIDDIPENGVVVYENSGLIASYEFMEDLYKYIGFFLQNYSKQDIDTARQKYYNEEIENCYKYFEKYDAERAIKKRNENEKFKLRFDELLFKPLIDKKQLQEKLLIDKIIPKGQFPQNSLIYPILYYLIKNNKVVRIGHCTKELLSTIEENSRKYDFDSYCLKNIPEEYLYEVKSEAIIKYNPIYNTPASMQLSPVYNTLANIRKRYNLDGDYHIDKRLLQRLISENNLETYTLYTGLTYVKTRKLVKCLADFFIKKD